MQINKLKAPLLATGLMLSLNMAAYADHTPSHKSSEIINQALQNKPTQLDSNKKIVLEFYEGVFAKQQVKHMADQFLIDGYIQHNPLVSSGKQAFIQFFTDYFKNFPKAENQIKHVYTDGDFVILHVLSKQTPTDRGSAIIDVFKVKDGKITEHWDVIQSIPTQSANKNTMF